MARSYAILKDGIPYSNVFTSLRNPEKILNLWFERWKFSNNSNPPEGNYSVRVGIETALDLYGVKRKG